MQKKILSIDNDPDILDVMQGALSYEGFEVNTLSATGVIIGFYD